MNEKYYFTQLAARLEQVLQCDVGMNGLEILMHGWMRKGGINRETIRQRKVRDGEAWLNYFETVRFSEYAGYILY